jgi:threonine-phosphate decarboxylase
MEKHGILIRDASNIQTLDETYFRLCSQTSDKNAKLVEALKEWLDSMN